MSKRNRYFLFAAALATTASLGIYFGTRTGPAERPATPAPPAAAVLGPQMPAIPLGVGTALPTARQEAERAAVIDRQVATAAGWLRDGEARRRQDGAEQLAAYPTPAAEKWLVNTLRTEMDEGVLAAAARSLSYFDHPSQEAVAALLHTLENGRGTAKNAALNTLAYYAGHEPANSARLRDIAGALKKRADDKHLPPALRRAISATAGELAMRVR